MTTVIPPLVAALFRGMDGGSKRPGSEMSAHMPTLYLLARHYCKIGPIVDCGVGGGFSTTALLAGVSEGNGTLTSYDIAEVAGKYATICSGLSPGDALLKCWVFKNKSSFDAAGDWEDSRLGMLFLDTSHRLEDTRKELRLWLPKIHPQGIIAGHDYFLHETPGWEKLSGVKQAVDEFAEEHKGRFRLQILRYDQGIFIFWPK